MIGPIETPLLVIPLIILAIWSVSRLTMTTKKGFDKRSWRVPFFVVYFFAAMELNRYGFVLGPGGTHPYAALQNWAAAISFIGALVLLVT